MSDRAVRILLVDDEPQLLRLMQMYIEKLGYFVEACANRASALAAVTQAADPFDLLIADVTLPDGSGQEMAIELAGAHAHLCVLLCSGLPIEMSAIPMDLRDRFEELPKPFVPKMLAAGIEKLLRKHG